MMHTDNCGEKYERNSPEIQTVHPRQTNEHCNPSAMLPVSLYLFRAVQRFPCCFCTHQSLYHQAYLMKELAEKTNKTMAVPKHLISVSEKLLLHCSSSCRFKRTKSLQIKVPQLRCVGTREYSAFCPHASTPLIYHLGGMYSISI